MKQFASILLTLLLATAFVACGDKKTSNESEGANDTIGAVVRQMRDTVALPSDGVGYMVYQDKEQRKTNFDGARSSQMAYVLPGKNLMVFFNTMMVTKKGVLYEIEVYSWVPEEKGVPVHCAAMKVGRMKGTITSDFAFAETPQGHKFTQYVLLKQGKGDATGLVSKTKVNNKFLHFVESPEVRLIVEDILRQPNYAELRAYIDGFW